MRGRPERRLVAGALAGVGLVCAACSGSSPAMPGNDGVGGEPVPPTPVDTLVPWPGAPQVSAADDPGRLGDDLSGLVWLERPDAPPQLWAVQNNPGRLFRLVPSGGGSDGASGVWRPEAPGSWESGRRLRYPSASGSPDAEGVTLAALSDDHAARAGAGAANDGAERADVYAASDVALQGHMALYVATERDNDVAGVSRNAVLRFEVDPVADPLGASGTDLVATHEWNLTDLLPSTGANGGLEAITWVPDETLVAKGFLDERTGRTYEPGTEGDHGGGLVFVGLEETGEIHALMLRNDTGMAEIVQRIEGPFEHITALEHDVRTGDLWALCDDRCGGRTAVLRIGTSAAGGAAGRYQVVALHRRPDGADNWNVEGLAIAPDAYCDAGRTSRPVVWSDDGATDDHALREGALSCER